MEMHELLKKKPEEITKMIQESREELRQTRFDVANMSQKDVRRLRVQRKNIARMQTALGQLTETK